MREIVLDTETTGLRTKDGDRITEIGCVEIFDKKLTGLKFHTYVNPERELSIAAMEISGLTYDFLKKYKTFDGIAGEFLDFIGNDRLVIHNAPFDMEFLNYELNRAGKPTIRNHIIDTLAVTKQKFPGSPVTLDALCNRFSIDKSSRTKHGALIDAELLAHVYILISVEVTQRNIFSVAENENEAETAFESYVYQNIIPARNFEFCQKERELHDIFLKKIKKPLWNNPHS
jgi:DNA polymerase-3 subunit epsilon